MYEDDILAKAKRENNYYPPAKAGGNKKAGGNSKAGGASEILSGIES